MTVRIVSTFIAGREARNIECDDCGYTSAGLWADKYGFLINVMADEEAASHRVGVARDIRGAAKEIRRLRGELDSLEAKRQEIVARLAELGTTA